MKKSCSQIDQQGNADEYLQQLAAAILTLRKSAQHTSVKNQDVMRAAAERIQAMERDLARCRAKTAKGALVKLGVLSERLNQGGELDLVASLMTDIRRLAKA